MKAKNSNTQKKSEFPRPRTIDIQVRDILQERFLLSIVEYEKLIPYPQRITSHLISASHTWSSACFIQTHRTYWTILNTKMADMLVKDLR
jgi:hypothetical protein